MNALWWKEWRELRLYAWLFLAWMVLATVYQVAYEMGHHYRAVVGGFSVFAMMYELFGAVMLGMHVSRGEQSSRTIEFTTALPVSIRHWGAIRLLTSLAVLVVPILVGAALMSVCLASGLVEQAIPRSADQYVRLPDRESASLAVSLGQLWGVTAMTVASAAQLLFVISLLGNFLKTRAQVGFLGVVIAFAMILIASLPWETGTHTDPWHVFGAFMPQSMLVHWGYGDRSGSYADHEIAANSWPMLAFVIPQLLILGGLFVGRYGGLRRPATTSSRRRWRFSLPRFVPVPPRPVSSRWLMMIWLELSQAVPLAVIGLLLAVLMALTTGSWENSIRNASPTTLSMALPHATFAVGMFWSAVVAAGLFSSDFSSGLANFWRSRPISPGVWFWNKYLVGLLAVVLVLDGSTILASWNAPRAGMTSGMSWAYIACMPLLHAFLFTVAVAFICLVRQPILGAILSFAAYTIFNIAITTFPATNPYEPISIYNDLLAAERGIGDQVQIPGLDLTQSGYPVIYGGILLITMTAAVVAWRCSIPLEPTRRWLRSLSA